MSSSVEAARESVAHVLLTCMPRKRRSIVNLRANGLLLLFFLVSATVHASTLSCIRYQGDSIRSESAQLCASTQSAMVACGGHIISPCSTTVGPWGPGRLGTYSVGYYACNGLGPQGSGYSWFCQAPLPFDPDKNGTCPNGCGKGDPINAGTADYVRQDQDIAVGRWLKFVRYYKTEVTSAEFAIGAYWRHTYSRSVEYASSPPTSVIVRYPNGIALTFNLSGTAWTSDADVQDSLTEQTDGNGNPTGWTLVEAGSLEASQFDGTGTLQSVKDANGFLTTLTYSTSSTPSTIAPAPGYLITVTDPALRTLQFTYTSAGALNTIVDPNAQTYTYLRDTSGNLASVSYPGSTYAKQYVYNEQSHTQQASLVANLTGVVDENNSRYATIDYDASGNAIGTQLAGGANKYSIVYNAGLAADITDPANHVSHTAFIASNGVVRPNSVDSPGLGSSEDAADTYDPYGNINSKTDFNGRSSCYTFDTAHGLETQRIEGVSGSCSGTPTGLRTVQTDWDTTQRVKTEVRVFGPTSALETKSHWIYNTRRQVLARCDIDPADTSGYTCSQTTAPPANAKVRRWVYAYCDTLGTGCPLVGLLKTVDGPRIDLSDVTSYAYYQTTDTSGCATLGSTCHYLGDLQTVTDALGHVTTYVSYDKDGRPTRIKDANATLTDMTYHARGWLLTRTVRYNASGSPSSSDATTTFAYDSVGNVKQVTQPDSSYLAYTYDSAHRLTDVQDNLSNKIHYTLDASGNRTLEQTYDPSSTLKRALTRQYDQLNRLTATLNAASAAVQTYTNPAEAPPSGITYTDGYDGNGNAIYSIDGTSLHVGTEQQYDGLNRLVTTLQDHAGTGATHNTTTQYAYDARANLRSVIDPDNLATNYTYDGLNNLTALSSPDTGNTGYTYDAAGNRISQTDARSVLTSYTYDALNRLTGTTYPTTSLNITYAYDQSNTTTGCSTSYPIGRLTRITDNSGSTTYCYDRRGNVLVKTQVTNGITLATTYTYTLADRVATISYPSTAVVTYTRNSIGQVTKITYKPTPTGTTSTLVSAATYYPYGPVNVLTFGNGRTLTKTYDQDYAIDKLVSSVSSGLVIDATVDVLGNLINASSTVGASPPTQQYLYDPLYRLTNVQTGSGTSLESFTYEATGDRTSKTQGSTQTYGYAPGTHHLISVAGVTRSIDANGNTTSLNGTTLTYDNRNRLSAAGTEAYNYNGKGERVSKSSPATLFTYSESGMLLGEYSSTGAVQREYVPMDGMLVGAATGSQIYYVETDQLGTPRQVIQPGTTPATDVQVWKWDYFANNSAFGENAPSPQTITFNPRFPGQYFDAETGLSYNYYRDYEEGTGRYLKSDPFALGGGVATYSYAISNPLRFSDTLGLFVCTTTEDCACQKDPANCPKPWPNPKPTSPAPAPTAPMPTPPPPMPPSGPCPSCKTQFPQYDLCTEIEIAYPSSSAKFALTDFPQGSKARPPKPATGGSCAQKGVHQTVFLGDQYMGSIFSCNCCTDTAGGPVIEQRWGNNRDR